MLLEECVSKSRARRSARVVVIVTGMFLCLSHALAQHPSTPKPQRQDSKVAEIQFSVPEGFKLERSSDSTVAFMRHPEISLFIAVPEKQVDEKYLTELSNILASQLLPQQQGFVWKQRASKEPVVSKYQIGGGNTKGLNATTYVQTDYVVLKMRDRQIVVGSIGTYGQGLESAYQYDHEGHGYSFVGWRGLFHLIPSITGEKPKE